MLALIVIILAFIWLLYETDILRVRLLVGDIPVNSKDNPISSQTEGLYKPSQFESLPMPETTGNITILCRKGV